MATQQDFTKIGLDIPWDRYYADALTKSDELMCFLRELGVGESCSFRVGGVMRPVMVCKLSHYCIDSDLSYHSEVVIDNYARQRVPTPLYNQLMYELRKLRQAASARPAALTEVYQQP